MTGTGWTAIRSFLSYYPRCFRFGGFDKVFRTYFEKKSSLACVDGYEIEEAGAFVYKNREFFFVPRGEQPPLTYPVSGWTSLRGTRALAFVAACCGERLEVQFPARGQTYHHARLVTSDAKRLEGLFLEERPSLRRHPPPSEPHRPRISVQRGSLRFPGSLQRLFSEKPYYSPDAVRYNKV